MPCVAMRTMQGKMLKEVVFVTTDGEEFVACVTDGSLNWVSIDYDTGAVQLAAKPMQVISDNRGPGMPDA